MKMFILYLCYMGLLLIFIPVLINCFMFFIEFLQILFEPLYEPFVNNYNKRKEEKAKKIKVEQIKKELEELDEVFKKREKRDVA